MVGGGPNITRAPARLLSRTPFPSPTHRYLSPRMTISIGKNVFLALLLAFVATVYAGGCKEPRVRREWRSISEAEREEWIAAVKVWSSHPDVILLAVADSIVVPQEGAP